MNVHDTLLLACGTSDSREALRAIFEDSFNLLETANSQQTLLFLKQNHPCIAAVLLDIGDSDTIDFDILSELKEYEYLKEVPFIVIAKEFDSASISRAFDWGAVDVVAAHYDPFIIQRRVENIVDLYYHKRHLEEVVKEQEELLQHSNDTLVDALSSIIEYRSVESGQHILRIRHFTKILLEEIARCCPEYRLTDKTIRIISSASALHDIGKIAIPDSILNKPGKLTKDEWGIMRSHTLSGCHILETLHDIGNQEYLRYAHNICHYHHERWDGGGYPEGIAGDDIPICAQVVGLADAYDALTTKRVYKNRIPYSQAASMILNGECGAFSPKLLECFKHVADRYESLAQAYADGQSPKSENFDVSLPGPDYQHDISTLQSTQSKYLTLLHHMNSTALEIDFDQDVYHSIYNPHLDLAPLSASASFAEASRELLRMVVPEEHMQVHALLNQDIPQFFRSGTRRQIHYVHVRSITSGQPVLYQLTLLRPDLNDPGRKLMLICQRVNEEAAAVSASLPSDGIPASDTLFHKDAIHGLLTGLFRYHNNRWFTLDSRETRLSALLGYTDEEIQTNFHGHLIELVVPSDRDMVRQVIAEQLKSGPNIALGFRLRHKAGHSIWVLNKSHLVVEADGTEYLYGTLTDITQNLQTQQELRLNLERYQTILEQTESIVFEWDPETDTAYFSRQWEDILGYPPLRNHVLEKLATATHFHPENLPAIIQMFHGMKYGDLAYKDMEVRIANRNGRYLWFRLRKTAVRDDDGRLLKIVGLIINIDDEKQAERTLKEQAERDILTKLLNKHTARKQAEIYLSSTARNLRCALLIIDLDNFKQINDQYGHMFGDAVLAQTAREIKKLFRSQDIIGRIGGDEFMVLMRDINDRELVENRCTRLISSLHTIYDSQMEDNPLSCSIGIALAPDHGSSYYDLFQHADQALYQTKDEGKNGFSFYDPTGLLFRSRQNVFTAINERIDSDEQPGLADKGIVQYAFQQLYKTNDLEQTINELLALVGKQMNVSRVYIFENNQDNTVCSNTFEWCNSGVEPQIELLQGIRYERDIPGYRECYDENGIFYCPDITTLARPVYDIVAPQGIKSMLHCAIMDHGVFRGYIGFDECFTHRIWTKDQINVLTFFSEMLSTVLLKKRIQDAVELQSKNLASILNNQNAWIYVINPDTCQLLFLNSRTTELIPDVKVGMKCYKSLMGLEERCPGCPARGIRQTKTQDQIMVNPIFNLEILSEATLIHWDNEDACLVTCREMHKALFPR